MTSSSSVYMFLFVLIPLITTIHGLTTSCQKNRFIDYNQMIETTCVIETCILSSNCTRNRSCECKRDFVVRYNVTIEHDDDEDDDHDDEDDEDAVLHLAVITYRPIDDDEMIIIGESYRCFYDERDVTTVFWTKPNRRTYFILLTLSLILVFSLILVPIVYLVLIIKFTNPETKKNRK